MSKPTPTFYIFHGNDEFGLSQQIRKMKADMAHVDSAGMNTEEYDGTETKSATVVSSVGTFPFLADRRLVLVKNMLSWITRKGAGEMGKQNERYLLDELPHLPDYSRLVFVEFQALPKSNKVLQLAESSPNGFVKAFEAPKNLNQWISSRAKSEYQAEIKPDAATALASVVNGDVRRADNELLKLVAYANGTPITEAMVIALTPYSPEVNLFEMVNEMATGNGGRALTLLHQAVEGPNKDPFQMWGLFTRQFRLMLLVKEQDELGTPSDAIATELQMSDFIVNKTLKPARLFSLENLETIYAKLLEYDQKVKVGEMDILMALDLLVAGTTRTEGYSAKGVGSPR